MSLIVKDDYVKQALSRLFSYDRKPIKSSLVAISAKSCQEVDDILYMLANNLYLNTATGYFLDRAGNDFFVYREGRNDEDYRDAIYAQIEINMSGGQTDTIINAIKRMSGASRVVYTESGIANFFMHIVGGGYVASLVKLVGSIKSAGVSFTLTTSEDDNYLRVSETYASTTTLTVDSGTFDNPSPGILHVVDETGDYTLEINDTQLEEDGEGFAETILNDVYLQVDDEDGAFLLQVEDETGVYYLTLALTDDERPRYLDGYGGKLAETII